MYKREECGTCVLISLMEFVLPISYLMRGKLVCNFDFLLFRLNVGEKQLSCFRMNYIDGLTISHWS